MVVGSGLGGGVGGHSLGDVSGPKVDVKKLLEQLKGKDQAWKLKAKCRGEVTDLFFIDRGESLEDAKKYCTGCPVRLKCLDYGLGEAWGFWGGFSLRMRRRIRRHRNAGFGWQLSIQKATGRPFKELGWVNDQSPTVS